MFLYVWVIFDLSVMENLASGRLGVNRITWILKKQEVGEWTIFIRIRIGTNDEVL